MPGNRIFNLLIGLALVVLVGLTVREASATSAVIAEGGSASRSHATWECASLSARSSGHAVYLQEIETWMPYTKGEPTGVGGGLIRLLSKYQTCSQ